MGIFQSDPENAVRIITGLLKKYRSSYDEPVTCEATAKIAVADIAHRVFSNDMEKYEYLRQSQFYLAEEYWEQIVENLKAKDISPAWGESGSTNVTRYTFTVILVLVLIIVLGSNL